MGRKGGDLSNELTSHVHKYDTKLGSIFDPLQELCLRQAEELTPQITAVRELDGKVSRLALLGICFCMGRLRAPLERRGEKEGCGGARGVRIELR
jgi:hypothetical protein